MARGVKSVVSEIKLFFSFLKELFSYLTSGMARRFGQMESFKGFFVDRMYRQRGKYSGVFVHMGVVGLAFLVITFGPEIVAGSEGQRPLLTVNYGGLTGYEQMEFDGGAALAATGGEVMGASTVMSPVTVESDKKSRPEVVDYEVKDGDTLSSIAEKFGVSMDTIRWANDGAIKSVNSIKPGQVLKIPPVDGIVHTVKSGETVYTIAKKYSAEPQAIVDFPFNTFTNDETFALAVGQELVIPNGVMPESQPWSPTSSVARVLTPDAGVVSATGSWIWPASGRITQGFYSWHQGIDIANHSGGPILAADSGRVIVAGWPDNWGYGNRIVIDHGNGYQTLYAHLSKFNVTVGQSVKRGDVIAQMGSTGRSTGTHLHFEIRYTGGRLNPLNLLK